MLTFGVGRKCPDTLGVLELEVAFVPPPPKKDRMSLTPAGFAGVDFAGALLVF